MVKIQLRGDTLERWEKYNPVIAEREIILIASDPDAPDDYNLYKIGDGKRKFKAIPYHGLPAVQERGESLIDVMSQRAVTGELVKLEEKLKKVEAEIIDCTGNGHRQNTDTGTDSHSFLINDVLLKCCCNDLVLRSACDCNYADLTLKDLYVKGKIYLDGGIFETTVEEIRTKNNMIILNEGETGEGVTRGIAGIQVDRGTEEPYYIIFEEKTRQLKAGIGSTLYAVPLVGGEYKTGDVPTWDEEKQIFTPGTGAAPGCMKMETPFPDGKTPVWNEEKGLFIPEAEETAKNYMEMLPPFQQGDIPAWDDASQLFIPVDPIPPNIMLKDEGILPGDGVIWDADKKLFVSGIPYDPLNMRKDRIQVYSALPTINMQDGDIIIIAENAPAPPDTPEEHDRRNPYLMKSDIADNLVTDNPEKVLSARQGYLLSVRQPDERTWGDPEDFKDGFKNANNKN